MTMRRTILASASGVAATLLLGSIAWACTVMTGWSWLCSSSTGCADPYPNIPSFVKGSTAYMQGDAGRFNEEYELRYASGHSAGASCHSGTQFNGNATATTDGSGDFLSGGLTLPNSAANWTACAITSDDVYGFNHTNFTTTN